MPKLPRIGSPGRLYTIGHSNHPLERFVALLRQHGIGLLADVRSTPFSRFNPQFNRQRLQQALAEVGIEYLFLGEELGARSKDPAHYENDRISYRKLAASEPFQRGLARLLSESRQQPTAMMCAEREPLDCHRTILVAREVARTGSSIVHILADGSLEDHDHVMRRLIARLKLPAGDLFATPAEVFDLAYDTQATRVSYSKPASR